MFSAHDVLTFVGQRAAVVAGSVVRRTVDGCRPADATAARDARSTTAADDRRHRTVVQTASWGEVGGQRRPAGDESDEQRPSQQRRGCLATESSQRDKMLQDRVSVVVSSWRRSLLESVDSCPLPCDVLSSATPAEDYLHKQRTPNVAKQPAHNCYW